MQLRGMYAHIFNTIHQTWIVTVTMSDLITYVCTGWGSQDVLSSKWGRLDLH